MFGSFHFGNFVFLYFGHVIARKSVLEKTQLLDVLITNNFFDSTIISDQNI